MPSDPALELQNVSVALAGAPYVRDASLCVPRGEIHGLLGLNGAGKTTLLRTLYKADRPTTGTIRALGRDMQDYGISDWARTVGALVQSAGLLAGLTPRDIVEIGLAMHGFDRYDMARRRDEALGLVGLADKADQSASRLSGGELQRCYFAQLLAHDPEIYILDEPTNHLDLHYQLVLLDEVRRRGKTALMTLHDLTLAMRYCDQVYLMKDGRIVERGRPQHVLSRETLQTQYRVDGQFENGALSLSGPISGPPYSAVTPRKSR